MSINTAGFALPKPGDAAGLVELSPHEYRKLKDRVYEEQAHRCAFCTVKLYRVTDGDLHHLKHRGMGGCNRDDRRENVVLLCSACHRRQHNQ
jgi:5-methylcytosine-specific restriction endonuclease McrA